MDRFISPNGSPSNPGTRDAAWSLREVLEDGTNKYAQPGDTVYLLPGEYRWPNRAGGQKGFRFRCKGTPDAPITFTPENRHSRVTIDGGMFSVGPNVNDIPSHLRFVGLEFLASENLTESRKVTGIGSDTYAKLNRPYGGVDVQDGHDVRFVHCIVHHASGGFGFWGRVSGESELYGNIIYDNGWVADDRRHGVGIYGQNNGPDWKHFVENVLIENYSEAVQIYGSSAAYTNQIRFERNVGINTAERPSRMFIGSGNPAKQVIMRGNLGRYCFLQLGYGLAGDDAVFTDNVSWFTGIAKSAGWTNLKESNNLSWQTGWANPRLDGVTVKAPPSTAWLMRSAYDADRATIVVHNYQSQPNIAINVADFADAGDTVELFDPRDFFGTPKHAFVIDGSTFTLPLDGSHACYVAIVDRDPCSATKREVTRLSLELDNVTRILDTEKEVSEARRLNVQRLEADNESLKNIVESVSTQLNNERSKANSLQEIVNRVRLAVNE